MNMSRDARIIPITFAIALQIRVVGRGRPMQTAITQAAMNAHAGAYMVVGVLFVYVAGLVWLRRKG